MDLVILRSLGPRIGALEPKRRVITRDHAFELNFRQYMFPAGCVHFQWQSSSSVIDLYLQDAFLFLFPLPWPVHITQKPVKTIS